MGNDFSGTYNACSALGNLFPAMNNACSAMRNVRSAMNNHCSALRNHFSAMNKDCLRRLLTVLPRFFAFFRDWTDFVMRALKRLSPRADA